MSRREYRVTVSYTMERDLTIWAEDADEAEEKAVEIVEGWKDVKHAEATDVERA